MTRPRMNQVQDDSAIPHFTELSTGKVDDDSKNDSRSGLLMHFIVRWGKSGKKLENDHGVTRNLKMKSQIVAYIHEYRNKLAQNVKHCSQHCLYKVILIWLTKEMRVLWLG